MTSVPEYKFLDLNRLRFHYVDWGGHGRPLVLLHGLASNARFWDLVVKFLLTGAVILGIQLMVKLANLVVKRTPARPVMDKTDPFVTNIYAQPRPGRDRRPDAFVKHHERSQRTR